MTSGFKDHFSADSGAYAAYRPAYPARLFSRLAEQCHSRNLAWDCATGSGQAACGLADHFSRVIATDASRSQIVNAVPRDGVKYLVSRAERPPLGSETLDLVTVAQALHWFDTDRFFEEVERVLKPGGVIAVWSYNLFRSISAIDEIIDHLYHDVLGAYWPPERRLVEEGYRSVDFPFFEMGAFHCQMEADSDLERVLGYLGTWSAVKRHLRERGKDPLVPVREAMESLGLDPRQKIRLIWPLQMRVGRKAAGGRL